MEAVLEAKYKVGDIIQIKESRTGINNLVKITNIGKRKSRGNSPTYYKIKMLRSFGERKLHLKFILCGGGFGKCSKRVPLLKAKLYET